MVDDHTRIGGINVLDHGYVLPVESWGSDERIIESARMSTDGAFRGWGPKEDGKPGDEKLLRYLYEHKHLTPFEMCGLTFEVQAPIFVLREWQRHRTQSFNELSARYTELPALFYLPSEDRLFEGGQCSTNKQASGAKMGDGAVRSAVRLMFDSYRHSYAHYGELLALGLAREIARSVLPVSTYSRMRVTANLRNWLGFLSLRLDESAQWEIRQYAEAAAVIVSKKFPRTYELFRGSTTA